MTSEISVLAGMGFDINTENQSYSARNTYRFKLISLEQPTSIVSKMYRKLEAEIRYHTYRSCHVNDMLTVVPLN